MLEVRHVDNIAKEYPDMYKVIVFKTPRIYVKSDALKRPKELVSDNYTPKISSLNRTKSMVKDIVMCNDFEYFCTFTFDPKKIDSFNFNQCYHKISTWIHHQRENSRLLGVEFKYLFIPEKHKSGRWHFHALISGYKGFMKPSGVVTNSYNPVYNITSFRSGFTTAVPISSREGVANYVAKYITKDFIKTFNQRRFFASRNLVRPVKTLNSKILHFTPPMFRTLVFENADSFEYFIDKKFDSCENGFTGNVGQCISDDDYGIN